MQVPHLPKTLLKNKKKTYLSVFIFRTRSHNAPLVFIISNARDNFWFAPWRIYLALQGSDVVSPLGTWTTLASHKQLTLPWLLSGVIRYGRWSWSCSWLDPCLSLPSWATPWWSSPSKSTVIYRPSVTTIFWVWRWQTWSWVRCQWIYIQHT